MSKKTDVFNSVLNEFETAELKEYCMDMIDEISDTIFKIPSSTSLKYHNATQCQPGGQSYHVLMAGTILNYILGLEYIKNKFPKPKQRDCFRTAILLHDALKIGDESTQYTVHEHPILAGKWVETTAVEHDIDEKLKKYISRLIQSHSGEWTTSNKSNTILPSVENDEQFLIHLCDYLASRNNLDMIYNSLQENAVRAFQDLVSPEEYIFTFGKYKGMTFEEVAEGDYGYIEWLKNSSNMGAQEPLKSLLEGV